MRISAGSVVTHLFSYTVCVISYFHYRCGYMI